AEGRHWLVEGVSRQRPPAERVTAAVAVAAMAAGVPLPDVTIERLPPIDWLAATRSAFPPIDIPPFHIYGSHVETPPPAGRIGICIDAATAFGSGEHPTTEGCRRAIAGLARAGFRPPRTLARGSGSGSPDVRRARA